MIPSDRALTILADGEPVSGYARAILSGSERLDLLPAPFTLRLFNLPSSDFLLLSRCRAVTVSHGDALLLSGPLQDLYVRDIPSGTLLTAVLSPALPLWQAPVSLSLPASTPLPETLRRILQASGTGVRLLSFPGEAPVSLRPRAFFGRASECVTEALSEAGARPCLLPSGLSVVPRQGLPLTLTLTGEDLLAPPSVPRSGGLVLRVCPAGWTLGKGVAVRYGAFSASGLISERFLSLDTGDGPWRMELFLEPFPPSP